MKIGLTNKNINKYRIILLLFITTVILSGCATHYNVSVLEPYGFFYGIWHGFCAPFVLIGKILSWGLNFFDIVIFQDIRFIGKPNTGMWYGVGYFLGLSGALLYSGASR